MNVNKKISKFLLPDNKIYLIIILMLNFSILYYNKTIAGLGFLVVALLSIYTIINNKKKMSKWTKYIENLSQDLGTAAQSSIINLPLPLSLLNFEGKLVWYNSKFLELFKDKDLLDVELTKIVPQINTSELFDDKIEIGDIKIGDKFFELKKRVLNIDSKNKENSYILMLYWIEKTEYVNLKTKYNEDRPVVALVEVDNYDEVINSTKEEKVPFVLSEIESKINLWMTRVNGIVKKHQNDKYLVIFENKYLENIELKKFSILDEMREIDSGNKIPITLSIGVGIAGKNFDQLEEYAFSALELALARGGDQAAVRKNGSFDFYGGKTKAVEKRNRVKARIVAHAFRPLIDESDKIFIMGHKNPDMDAFGAAIGVYRAALNRGKEAYIILNEINSSIKNIYTIFKNDDVYKFIPSAEALDIISGKDMLVVVDTHRPSFTECPEMIPKTNKVVLIDHHRRGTEFIEDTVLNYLEPYASSASELVTEVLQYMEDKVYLRDIEAEALLAGIVLDTKSFSLKTGVRTFEAASFLRRNGANIIKVTKLFQEDVKEITIKSEIVSNSEILFENVAISIYEKEIDNIQLVAAQSADELLKIKGIETSFVIGKKEGGVVFISGRSLGEANVQVILEKLGGGGHLNNAGAQFENKTVEEVKKLLIKVVDEYIKER